MSEEIKHPGMELNEAELEGVSGGASATIELKATDLCHSCPRYKKNCDNHDSRMYELVKYMEVHGLLHSYSQCPSYNA